MTKEEITIEINAALLSPLDILFSPLIITFQEI
jgi:hypothetical protein